MKKCTVYLLFYIIFIIIFIIIPFFFVLLNCLYFNPRVLLFTHSPPHPTVGCLVLVLVASCRVKPQHYEILFFSPSLKIFFLYFGNT